MYGIEVINALNNEAQMRHELQTLSGFNNPKNVDARLHETIVDVADAVFTYRNSIPTREWELWGFHDSRETVQMVIAWAEEFARNLGDFDYNSQGWGRPTLGEFRSYIEEIDAFTAKKLEEFKVSERIYVP